MSDFIPSAVDPRSDLLLDTSTLQKSSLLAEVGQMIFYTSIIVSLAHLVCGVLEGLLGNYALMQINLGLCVVYFVFTGLIRRNPPSRFLIAAGAILILGTMALFLFLLEGPGVTVMYLLAPIPSFRILGLRWGWPMALSFMAMAAFSLFGSIAAVENIPWNVRVNILLGFLVAMAFGWLFERSRQKSAAILEESLKELRVLHGLISICASCKKLKEGENTWRQVEAVLHQDGLAKFTHGLCKPCLDDALNHLPAK